MAAECAEHCVNVFNCVVNVQAEPQPVVAVRDDKLLLCEFPLAGDRFFRTRRWHWRGSKALSGNSARNLNGSSVSENTGDMGPRWGLTFSGDDVQSWPYCDI